MLFNPVGRGRNTLQNYYPCFSKFCTPTALSFYLCIYLSIYCWGAGFGEHCPLKLHDAGQ